MARQMAEEVAHLDYAHPGIDYPLPGGLKNLEEKHVVEFSGRPPPPQASYPVEVIYQHLGAYMDFLGVDRFFDLPTLMGVGTP